MAYFSKQQKITSDFSIKGERHIGKKNVLVQVNEGALSPFHRNTNLIAI